MLKRFFKKLMNYARFLIFGVRIFTRKKAREISKIAKKGCKILEIGSGGKNEKGKYYFSSKDYFKDSDVDFIMSDVDPNFGHKILDIVQFNEENIYDHILCFNVLEHIYDWEKGFLNMYRALRENGCLHIIVPVFYPIHYSPNDYFRFTSQAFEEFCRRNNMKIDNIERRGFETYPFAYYLRIKKQ